MVDKLAYIAIEIVFKILGCIPRQLGYILSKIMGTLWFKLDRRHRYVAIENLTFAYSNEKTSYEIENIAKKVFKNLALILFEIGWFLRLDKKDFEKYCCVKGVMNLKKAYQKHQGVLILTGHMGNWELLITMIAMTEFPVSVVYRPLDFAPLDKFVFKMRSRFGANMLSKGYAAYNIIKNLKKGMLVGLLIDQNVDWYEGPFVNFFKKPTCTNKGLAMLALHTKAPVVPVFTFRENGCYVVEYCPEIPLVQTGDQTKDIEINTQKYNDCLEHFIRKYPDQWFWVHRRWKTKHYCKWSPNSKPNYKSENQYYN